MILKERQFCGIAAREILTFLIRDWIDVYDRSGESQASQSDPDLPKFMVDVGYYREAVPPPLTLPRVNVDYTLFSNEFAEVVIDFLRVCKEYDTRLYREILRKSKEPKATVRC